MKGFASKIHTLESGKKLIDSLKSEGKKIVFTNGCFDILHLGHVTYLEKARRFGDFLVLGLNSDASVRRFKGEGRPIQDEHNRSGIIAALASIDMVIVFDEDTPIDLIKTLAPDFLVKGADYKIEEIAGSDFVINNGGEVKLIDLVGELSTTKIIEEM